MQKMMTKRMKPMRAMPATCRFADQYCLLLCAIHTPAQSLVQRTLHLLSLRFIPRQQGLIDVLPAAGVGDA